MNLGQVLGAAKWLPFGVKVLPLVFEAVQAAEDFAEKKGKEKQDAAVVLVKELLEAAEGITDKDLLDNEAVDAAVRELIDAVVATLNVVSKAKALHANPSGQ